MEEEFEGEPIVGGYDFVFVDELSPGQTCPICLLAMRSPVQTWCGHRFCESCLSRTFRQGYDRLCPQDRNPIDEDGGVFPDVAYRREILSLRVKCKKNERGCDWTGELRHNEEHVNLCGYEYVTCNDCSQEMERRLLYEHSTSECENRIVQCEYCDEEFVFRLTDSHQADACTRFPLDCPQECGLEIPREEVEFHVRDDCMMTMVMCPYEGAGCAFHDRRSYLTAHLEASSDEHLRKTCSTLLRTTERLNVLEVLEGQKGLLTINNREEIQNLRIENRRLRKNVVALEQQFVNNKQETDSLRMENRSLRKIVATLEQQFENNKKETDSLKQLVQTLKSKVEANEEKCPDTPLTRRPKSVSLLPVHSASSSGLSRPATPAAGYRIVAGKRETIYSKSRLPILVCYLVPCHNSAYGFKNLTPISVWSINRKLFGRRT